jgi:hypothetical protein
VDTLAKHEQLWNRLLGIKSSDQGLTEQGEAVDQIFLQSLNEGYRSCQLWLIENGFRERWRKRTAAIATWSGTDADGGRYVNLTTGSSPQAADFLRLDGNQTDRSALVKANGDQWGVEVSPDEDWARGDYYYLKADQLWLARAASVPNPAYLRYYYAHPAITSATTTFDMPEQFRRLAVLEAAYSVMFEGWIPDAGQVQNNINNALQKAREDAKRFLPRTREPMKFKPAKRSGASHW